MYIDKHYPFEMVKLDYSLTSFEPFLDFKTMSIHYNQIYKNYIEKLNELLKDLATLHPLCLDEILFNDTLIPISVREKVINNASGAYNHQIIFKSITPNPIVQISSNLKGAIEKKYKTLNNFFNEFKNACINLSGCGFVFLVCNEKGDVFIESVKGNTTTVKKNLCPLMGIDLFEHAYFLKYNANKNDYIKEWFKYINYDYVNKEYNECINSINMLNK